MPEAICVRDAPWRLSPRRTGLRNARASPWCILRRLLLGADGAFARGRRDERALDRPPRVTRLFGEGYFHGAPDCAHGWHSSHCGRRVAIVNGNVLTARTPRVPAREIA